MERVVMPSHILVSNPAELANKYSNENSLGYELDYNQGLSDELSDLIDEKLAAQEVTEQLDFTALEKYLSRIPDREADLIRLYHKDKMKQEQIAKLFGITQAAVSYRLHRGIKRIQFLRTIPELCREVFEMDLKEKFNDQDREILWRMYETTCQSEIAKQMNLTQGRVRHRFFRALNRIKELIIEEVKDKQEELKQAKVNNENTTKLENELDVAVKDSKYSKYWKVYHSIADKKFNILHEVKLPQFVDRGDAQIITMTG
jgi:DNA-directed RNA polymerase specialized sigma24 family protein